MVTARGDEAARAAAISEMQTKMADYRAFGGRGMVSQQLSDYDLDNRDWSTVGTI